MMGFLWLASIIGRLLESDDMYVIKRGNQYLTTFALRTMIPEFILSAEWTDTAKFALLFTSKKLAHAVCAEVGGKVLRRKSG